MNKKLQLMCAQHKKLRQDGFICLLAMSACALFTVFTYAGMFYENYVHAFIGIILAFYTLIIAVPYVVTTIKSGDTQYCKVCAALNEESKESKESNNHGQT